MSVALDIAEVRKTFGTGVAVERAAFTVEGNEFVSIVGPSGCGKSTLLRMVAGLIPPSAGRITVGGRVVDLHVERLDLARRLAVETDRNRIDEHVPMPGPDRMRGEQHLGAIIGRRHARLAHDCLEDGGRGAGGRSGFGHVGLS